MTIKDIIQLLEQQGKVVQARKRSDGGYLITRIDGMSFKGASGNIHVRKIVGAELSHARAYQLERIKPPKKVAPMKRKLAPLPSDILKELRKVQRLWRKEHKDISGIASTRNVRYQLEIYGEDFVRASLNKSYRYAQGYAYIENVRWLIERWQTAKTKANYNDIDNIDRIINLLEHHMLKIREDWIHGLYYEAYYPFIQGQIGSSDALRITQEIMRS